MTPRSTLSLLNWQPHGGHGRNTYAPGHPALAKSTKTILDGLPTAQ
jgi:hypothetical protein